MKDYITLNEQGFAETSGWVVCYLTNPDGEYIGYVDEFIPATSGVPACAYSDAPPVYEAGKAIIRADGKWVMVDDHRGETVYSTENGQPIEVKALGNYPDKTTLIPPGTPYDKWDGKAWVTDYDALKAGQIAEAEQQRQNLTTQANEITADWRTELSLGIIDDNDKAKLTAWMKYIKAVKAVDTSTAPDVSWPKRPS
ncbi:tail fiber assembly protein [Enterobacter roggenkampii]|uniref:tail fiber assembly protein n=1 Tax=Enterobacter roggenkampii TaxID=1812935 RepID=UPI003BE4616F